MNRIKRKKASGIPYNIIAASQRAPRLNHWQVMLLLLVNHSYVAISPQCMNV